MRALVSRPREDAERIAAPLRAMGVEVVNEPLLVIVPVAGPNVDLTDVRAVLLTSANGARALATAVDRRDVAVYAVGEQTARAARDLGFGDVESAGGDVESLARLVRAALAPADGPLLHAAGTSLAGDLAGMLREAGFEVRVARLYEARPTAALSQPLQQALKRGEIDIAFFYSPRTARTFVEHVRKAGLQADVHGLTAYALSPAVARELEPILAGHIRVAEQPSQDALLALFHSDVKEVALKPPETSATGTPAERAGSDRTAAPEDPTAPAATPPEAAAEDDRRDPPDSADAPATAAPGGDDTPAASVRDAEATEDTTDTATDDRTSGKTDDRTDDRTDDKEDSGTDDTTHAAADARSDDAGHDPSHTDRHADDGEAVYAGSAGRPAKQDTATAPSAEEQAEHRTLRSLGRWLLVLIVLGALAFGSMPWWRDQVPAPLQAWLPELPAAPDPPAVVALRAQVTDLTGRLDELGARVTTATETAEGAMQTAEAAREAAAAAPEAPAVDDAALADLRDRLAALEDRVQQQGAAAAGSADGAAQATALSTARLDALDTATSTLSEAVAALETRVAAVETAVATDDEARAVGLVLSLGLLRQRVDAGKPYTESLDAVATIGPGPDAGADMATLAAHAETGVPTLTDLRRAYADASKLAARRVIVPEGDGWWTDTVSSLMSGVTVRRNDEVVVGGPLSALSTAETRLADGDLTGAIEALSTLEGDPAAAVADWLADAESRASVDAALASLNAAALERVGAAQTTE
ncbi:uroporphyrinogen-III synthase [Roseospira goensis]|uniref:Uroporphyrinogen-III synthase n=1 Tax=Roseospira goensis TaxID=391922 RepID=A0A7W6WLN3_9PROT|nr:uroporphyrinogen-III synthase [Roseospira goensis]MBB4286903.1 uroporphyrinogen-III synthase [Roseospira goensis]